VSYYSTRVKFYAGICIIAMKLTTKEKRIIHSLQNNLKQEPVKVLDSIESLLSRKKTSISPLYTAYLHDLKAKAYLFTGDNEEAFQSILETESMNREMENKQLLIDINNNKGILNAKIGNFPQAIKCFQYILENIPDENLEKRSPYLLNLGTLYLNIRDYKMALEIWERCLKHFKEEKNHYNLAICYHNFGKAYGEQENRFNAIQSFKKAIQHYEKVNIHLGKADSLDGLAKTYLSTNEIDKAQLHAHEALKIFKKQNSKSGVFKISCILGIIEHKMGNSQKGIQICLAVLKKAKKLKNETIIRRCLESLYEIHIDGKDYKAALEITKTINAFKEALLDDHKQSIILQTQKEMDYLREQREIDRKELEIERLNRELIIKTMEINKRKEFLKMVKTKLSRHFTKSDTSVKSEINSLLKETDQILNGEQNWDDFKKYFSSIHTEFFGKMYDLTPNITSTEARICTYLKLNLSTKEIASNLNLSVRTVENNRLRIRKKFNLERDKNLSVFLQHL